MKKPLPTRRRFLAASATATFGFQFFRGHLFGAEAPSNKLNLAAIGVGAKGQGTANLKACAGENIVALCDVDADYAAPTFARYPSAKTYVDYRVMLEKQKDIDAVIIATPDHTHAVITLAALAAGKHVYCQKPLTHTVREARTITEAARRAKVQTQMGNQGHSSESIRLLKEWLAAGVIGDVREVHAWTDRPVGGDPWSNFAVQAQSKDTPPVPVDLEPGRKLPGSGALIIGDKGTLLHGSHGAGGLRLLPETRMKEFVRPEKTLPRVVGSHEADWLRACKAGPGAPPPCSTFEYGGALTETVLLGVLAMRLPNQRLTWDSANLQFANNPAADALLHPPYRDGWSL